MSSKSLKEVLLAKENPKPSVARSSSSSQTASSTKQAARPSAASSICAPVTGVWGPKTSARPSVSSAQAAACHASSTFSRTFSAQTPATAASSQGRPTHGSFSFSRSSSSKLPDWLDELSMTPAFQNHRYIPSFATESLVAGELFDRDDSISDLFVGLAEQLQRDENRCPNVFVLAPPGSGKTTLVKYVSRFEPVVVAAAFARFSDDCSNLLKFKPWFTQTNVLPFLLTFNDTSPLQVDHPEDTGQTAIVARILYQYYFRFQNIGFKKFFEEIILKRAPLTIERTVLFVASHYFQHCQPLAEDIPHLVCIAVDELKLVGGVGKQQDEDVSLQQKIETLLPILECVDQTMLFCDDIDRSIRCVSIFSSVEFISIQYENANSKRGFAPAELPALLHAADEMPEFFIESGLLAPDELRVIGLIRAICGYLGSNPRLLHVLQTKLAAHLSKPNGAASLHYAPFLHSLMKDKFLRSYADGFAQHSSDIVPIIKAAILSERVNLSDQLQKHSVDFYHALGIFSLSDVIEGSPGVGIPVIPLVGLLAWSSSLHQGGDAQTEQIKCQIENMCSQTAEGSFPWADADKCLASILRLRIALMPEPLTIQNLFKLETHKFPTQLQDAVFMNSSKCEMDLQFISHILEFANDGSLTYIPSIDQPSVYLPELEMPANSPPQVWTPQPNQEQFDLAVQGRFYHSRMKKVAFTLTLFLQSKFSKHRLLNDAEIYEYIESTPIAIQRESCKTAFIYCAYRKLPKFRQETIDKLAARKIIVMDVDDMTNLFGHSLYHIAVLSLPRELTFSLKESSSNQAASAAASSRDKTWD